jgi:hypothetical protein
MAEVAELMAIPHVYRFFKEPKYADALAQGHVWLTTLEEDRKSAVPGRGDPLEAREFYFQKTPLIGDGDDPAFVDLARSAAIAPGLEARNWQLQYNLNRTSLPDGFVLSMAEEITPELIRDFGRHYVKIRNPYAAFKRIHAVLDRKYPIERGWFDRVEYKPQIYVDGECRPGPLGFVKQPGGYIEQREIRFLWCLRGNSPIKPRLFTVPGVARLCERGDA